MTESVPKKTRTRTSIYILLVIFILVIAAIGVVSVIRNNNQPVESTNCIRIESSEAVDKCVLSYDVAQTPEELAKGLSGRNSLPDNHGLVFVFGYPSVQCFWMKEMRFPIDIIWLNANKEIVHIEQNASPNTYPNAFCPNVDAQYVLEVNAGMAAKLNMNMNQKLVF